MQGGVNPQYFDLSGFIKKEAERLAKANAEISKTVFLNGKEEKKKMAISDWGKELNSFVEADINKKSFLGKYAADSIVREGQLGMMRYSAQKENLRTRELSVIYDKDRNPVKINAVLYTGNILYTSHQQLSYEPEKGFWISGKQTIRFLEPDTFSISTIFLP
ncbi:MAG: hypothetical protein SH857_04270 [Chitinophagales bacterium]|nr:hypothetical protein [Chitinophagales bacterium]